jgi:hypothetical protein
MSISTGAARGKLSKMALIGSCHIKHILIRNNQGAKQMSYIINRLKEPSTYAGLAALLAAFGLNVEPGILQAIVAMATGLAGLASILVGEKAA